MGLRDEHGAPRSVPIAIGILRALVIAARRARLKMDSEAGFLGDERLVALAIASEIERAVKAFGRSSNGGLIVTPSALAAVHRNLIIALAAQHKLPAVYYQPAAWSPMVPISMNSFGARPATLIASSRARSPVTCRCRCRSNTKQ
jgi:hypothetical protein